MKPCPVSPNTTATNTNQQAPTTPTGPQRQATQFATQVASVASAPVDPVRLAQVAQHYLYDQEMAAQVVFQPRAGKNRSLALERQLRRMAVINDPKWFDNFLLEARRKGENIINALPIVADDLGTNAARLEYTKRIGDLRDHFFDALSPYGLSRRDKGELFVAWVENGSSSRFRTVAQGSNLEKLYAIRQRNLTKRIRELGIPKATFDQLDTLVNQFVQLSQEELKVFQAAGVNVGQLEGIGYFPRNLTDDARARLGEAADKLFDEDGYVSSGVSVKSRTTYEWVVEDEYRAAEALGFVNKDELSHSVKQWRRVIEKNKEEVSVANEQWAKQQTEYGDALTKREFRMQQLEQQRKDLLTSEAQRIKAEHDNKAAAAMSGYMAYANRHAASDPEGMAKYSERLQSKLSKYGEKAKQALAAAEKRIERDYQKVVGEVDAEFNKVKSAYDNAEAAVQAADKQLAQSTADYTKELTAPVQRLYGVLDSETKTIQELLDLPEEKLNALVDDGVLSKAPMASSRVLEVVAKRYDMPYKTLSELIVTDPVKAHNLYIDHLQRMAGRSNMAQSIVRGAVEGGWGVSKAVVEGNKVKYAGYVPLTDALRGSTIDFDKANMKHLQGLYVPREVAQTYAAMMDVATQPAHLAYLGSFLNGVLTWNRVIKKSILSTPQFMMRNVFQSMVAGLAAGASLHHWIPSIVDMGLYMTKGIDAIDDTAKVYANGTMTLRDIFLQAKLNGRLDSTNFMGVGTKFSSEVEGSALNRLRYMTAAMTAGQPLEAAKQAVAALDIATSKAVSALIIPSTIIEDAMKIAVLKTRLGDAVVNRFGQLVSFNQVAHDTNFMDAARHLDHYFIPFDNATAFDKAMSSGVAPFWMYTSRNLPMQVRHVMRNPGRFAAYMRVYGMMNGDAEQREGEFPQIGATQWTLNMPQIFLKDPNGNPNMFYSVQHWMIDPLAEAMGSIMMTPDENTTLKAYESHLPGAKVADWVENFVNQLYPWAKTPFALYAGKDPFTGEEFDDSPDSLWGVNVPPVAGLSPKAVRYVLENALPYVRQVNKANPGGMFGVSEVRDSSGEVVREAELSLFGARRFDRDSQITGADEEVAPMLHVLNALGLNVVKHDILQNAQYGQTKLSSLSKEYRAEANREYRNAEKATDEQTREQALSKFVLYSAIANRCANDSAAVEVWLKTHGGYTSRERNVVIQYEGENTLGNTGEDLANDLLN